MDFTMCNACLWSISRVPEVLLVQIQDVMVEYFRKREGKMAKDGIGALQKSLAAIYYLPFQCGVNLYFRFSGQSIPNRCLPSPAP